MIGVSISLIFLFWASALLLGKKPKKIQELPRILIVSAIFVAIISAIGAAFYKYGIFHWKYNSGKILFCYVVLPLETLFIRTMYRECYLVCWVMSLFFEMLDSFASNAGFLFSPIEFFDLGNPGDRALFYIFSWGLEPFIQAAGVLLLYKTGFGRLFRNWISQKTIHSGTVLFLSLFPVLEEIICQVVRIGQSSDDNMALSLIFFLVIGIMFHYMWSEEIHKKQILEQEMNLQQQTRYIESLEGMQKEMRRFRHDFKNMMSGMYLQAKDGDLEAVQSFIQDMTADFDSQVGSQIRQLTQLGNIHMAEVKGLLLGKLDEMKKGQIGCEIEVLRPFYGTKMRVTDLCRCLGILIDNAMDEVRGQEKPMVSVLISVQDGCTTFRVKNRLYHAVDFHKIWTQGYSMHGQDRGIGLASYKKLLERYDNALPFTSVENGYFIQELKVKE